MLKREINNNNSSVSLEVSLEVIMLFKFIVDLNVRLTSYGICSS